MATFNFYRSQENWYMRIVRPLDGQIYDANAVAMAAAPSWANSVVTLVWDTATNCYPVNVPTLPNGRYDLLFYNAASPAAGDEVKYGQEYRYESIV